MVWHNGSVLVSIIEVNLRRARLVLGWVTVSRFNSRCQTSISLRVQLPRSTQPSCPFVGKCSEYQSKGGDALRLVRFVCGWQVKLGDRLVTYGSYMSALEIKGLYIKRYINSSVYFLLFYVTAKDNIISISSMFPVPLAAYTFLLASQQIQYRFVILCSW